jgi:hypothetical protein
MAYALSTQGQLTNTHVSLTNLANASTTAWQIGGTYVVPSLSTDVELAGASGATTQGLRVYADGRLSMRSGNVDRIITTAGAVQAGVPFTWKIVNNLTTGVWELYLNDMAAPVGTFARGTTAWAVNQIGRLATGLATPVIVRKFHCSGSTYSGTWDATTAPGLGVGWVDLTNVRALTLQNPGTVGDSWWIYYEDPAVPELDLCLSTKDQGTGSYVTMPPWVFNANANSGFATIEAEVSIDDFRGGTHGYIFGNSGSTSSGLRVNASTFALEFWLGGVVQITSPANAVTLGQKFKVKLQWSKAAGQLQMHLDGVQVGATYAVANLTQRYDQLGRFHTSQTTGITIYEVAAGGFCSTYNSRWDTYTILSTGTTWPDLVGNTNSRPLTIVNATGAADSWWDVPVGPPAGDTALQVATAASSAQSAALTTGATLSTTLSSTSSLSAGIAAGASLAVSAKARALVQASVLTQSSFSVTMTARSSLAASTLTIPSLGFAATLRARSSVTGQVTARPRLNAAATARSTTVAALSTRPQLAASVRARSTVAAALVSQTRLASAATSRSNGSASLSTRPQLGASISARSAVTAAIATRVSMAVSAASRSNIASDLTTGTLVAMAASLKANGRITAGLTSQAVLSSGLSSHSSASLSMTAQIQMGASLSSFSDVDAEIARQVRAMVRDGGFLKVQPDAEIGSGNKPIVMVGGLYKEQDGDEGVALVYDNGFLRFIQVGETLVI